MNNPDAERYNKVKDICLSIINKHGLGSALKMLNNYVGKLPHNAWIGLKAELIFYSNYFAQFNLDPLNDHGIRADFTGDVNGERCRIDVTTNINFKNLKDFDPIIQKSGRKYKIAIVNPITFNLEDFFDLNFPLDASRKGRQFDAAIFMPSEYNRHGECRYNYYQKIITFGSSCPEDDFVEQEICTDWYLPDIGTYSSDLFDANDGNPDFDLKMELDEYLASSAKLISKTTGRNIVACGCCHTGFLNPKDCEGEYTNTNLVWIHPVIKDYLPEYIDVDLSEYNGEIEL